MKKLLLCLFTSCSFSMAVAQSVLPVGSTVPLKVIQTIKDSDKSASVVVSQDVKLNGIVFIKAGTPVTTQLSTTQRKGVGKPGKITLDFISTTATNGEIVNLRGGSIYKEGRNKKGTALGLGIGLGIFCWPCLGCLAIKGGEAEITEGTMTTNVITANEINLLKFRKYSNNVIKKG